ncbi:MAG: hypothetical protein ACRYGA_08970 [Janthinobacterium lividum]
MHRPSRAFAPIVFALALALCLASTLGFMHRTLHLHTTPRSMATALSGAATRSTAADAVARLASRSPAGLGALFGAHTDADCRLYDQLAGGAAAPSVPLLVLPIAMPMARFRYFLGEAIARWVVLFDARGPPSTR